MKRTARLLAVLGGCAILGALAGCTGRKQVWIYTSLYKEMVEEMDPALHAVLPGVDIQWYQGGSENVAGKVNAELAAGGTKADLILTSDPFWYSELKRAGKLLPYDSPAARAIPAEYRDPEQTFVTVRLPVMILAYNPEAVPDAEAPKSWKDLASPKYKDKATMGSPLENGTMFTAVALLSQLYQWDYFQRLRALGLIATGGNSSVIGRVETKERPVGIALIESALRSRAQRSAVRIAYPTDGAIPVPSPIAILRDSKNPELAKRAYDWFFSEAAQKIMVRGGMYSLMPGIPAPEGARPWAELQKHLMPWSPRILSDLYAQREQIKAKFSEVVFH